MMFGKMFTKFLFPWLDGIHPNLKPLVMGAKKRGFSISYDAEAGQVTLESDVRGALTGGREIYDAHTGAIVMRVRS